MKVLRSFIREHIKNICLYVGFIGIFAVIFYLYNIRLDAVRYAFLLSVVWVILYGVLDFIHYAVRHRRMTEAEQKLEEGLKFLPAAGTIIERDYQRILEIIYEERIDLESRNRISRQEMNDYYSLWVHQIKTPIAAMRILLQSYSDSDVIASRSQMKEMKMELFKIEQYVEMVLTYLRLKDMSSDLLLKKYDIDSIVRQAVRKYSQMFILGKMKLNFEPSGQQVLTDEKWLQFVLEQIISNALKYTKEGSISIYMKDFKEQVKENGDVRLNKVLVIEDTGIGIQEEDLPRVFEKGFTGYNGRADKKSTGIGLYLCKSVMDKLQHNIWIESEVGKGTSVYLALGRRELNVE